MIDGYVDIGTLNQLAKKNEGLSKAAMDYVQAVPSLSQ